jgi:hypothetical protein
MDAMNAASIPKARPLGSDWIMSCRNSRLSIPEDCSTPSKLTAIYSISLVARVLQDPEGTCRILKQGEACPPGERRGQFEQQFGGNEQDAESGM